MKYNKKVAFDIDGVLRHLMHGLDRVYLRHYPDHVDKIKPHVDWDLSLRYPIGNDIYDFLFLDHPDEIFVRSPVFEGAWECFYKCRRLTTTGIITSQAETTIQPTLAWLSENEFRPDFIHVVYLDYQRGAKFNYKRNFTAKADVDDDIFLLIDDHTTNLVKWRDAGRKCLCVDRGYNQDWDGLRVRGNGVSMYNKLYDSIVAMLEKDEKN